MVKFLDKKDEREIVEAIRVAERSTSGEIRVHLKRYSSGEVMAEAKKVFKRFRMDRTKHRNAVLILVALKSRQFAIFGDEGIHRQVGDDFWKTTRDTMRIYFSDDKLKEGIVAGIECVGEKLKKHFPAGPGNEDELSNRVTED